MTDLAISPNFALQGMTAAPKDTPEKAKDAAEQFESLLMAQILRSARQESGGWLGEQDATAECATDYAEQQFATLMAKQGGLGLASMIAKGLQAGQAKADQARTDHQAKTPAADIR
jgi:Rod binding domain-containing protein